MSEFFCRLRDCVSLIGCSDFDGSRVGLSRAWEIACILHPLRAA